MTPALANQLTPMRAEQADVLAQADTEHAIQRMRTTPALAVAPAEPVTTLGDTEPGELDELEHPAITQARADTALPWWWKEAAAVIFVGTLLLSAAFPWGVAP